MELQLNEVCYNFYITKEKPLEWGEFYIGNNNIFIYGRTYSLHGTNDKIKLDITFINSFYMYNIDYIISNSYQKIKTEYYDTIEDAINIDEMIKHWVQYRDYKCTNDFKSPRTFNIFNGTLLNKIQYRQNTLVDYIVYNKMIKMEDMKYVPFCPDICRKINYVYDSNIFDIEKFNQYL